MRSKDAALSLGPEDLAGAGRWLWQEGLLWASPRVRSVFKRAGTVLDFLSLPHSGSRWTHADSVPLGDNYSDLGNKPPGQSTGVRWPRATGATPATPASCACPLEAGPALGPWGVGPHTHAHPRTRTHAHPHTRTHRHRLRAGPGQGRASRLRPRGPCGRVLSVPVLSRFPAPACACFHGAAVQPAGRRGRCSAPRTKDRQP